MPLDLTQLRETSPRRDAWGAAGPGRHAAYAFAHRTSAWPLAILTLATFVLLAPTVRATTYKWVDDQGKVHYTDKIPPEAINKGSVELNKQGVPIKKTDPALTPEQRQAREAEEERVRQAAKIREEIQRKDRALLQSYTTEGEIELSKKRALGTIDGQIQSAQAYMVTLNKRKQEIETRAAAPGKSPQAQGTEREIASVNEELEKQSDLIAAKRKEIAAVTARYDADKQRWRELRAIAETQPVGTTAAGGAATQGGNGTAAPAGGKK